MGSRIVETKTQESIAEFDRERVNAVLRFADLISSISVDQYDDMTFAKIVQHAIMYHGLPSSELADAFGVNKATVSRWSAGKNAPQPFARPVVINWIRDWMRATGRQFVDSVGIRSTGQIDVVESKPIARRR